MTIFWPDVFPEPTIKAYNISPGETIARTKMDSGSARQRRRFTAVPTEINARWIMPYTIFGLFQSWYLHEAREGAEWFNMKIQNGSGLQYTNMRFLKPYKAKPISHEVWEVTASLEIRDISILSEGALGILIYTNFTLKTLQASSELLHYQIHTQMPKYDFW